MTGLRRGQFRYETSRKTSFMAGSLLCQLLLARRSLNQAISDAKKLKKNLIKATALTNTELMTFDI